MKKQANADVNLKTNKAQLWRFRARACGVTLGRRSKEEERRKKDRIVNQVRHVKEEKLHACHKPTRVGVYQKEQIVRSGAHKRTRDTTRQAHFLLDQVETSQSRKCASQTPAAQVRKKTLHNVA